MPLSHRHWVALVALAVAGCEADPSPPPEPTCSTFALAEPVVLDSHVLPANTAQVVVTPERVWVAFSRPVEEKQDEHDVLLRSFDCKGEQKDQQLQANVAAKAGPRVLLAAAGDRLLAGWDGLSTPYAPPILRPVGLTSGDGGAETPLALSDADPVSQAALRLASLQPLAAGGFALVGTADAEGGACAQPFVQQLDEKGAPAGGFLDVYAGGLGRCATSLAPLQQGATGTLFLSWLSTDASRDVATRASLNDIFFSPALLGGRTQQYVWLPASTGIEPAGMGEVVAVSALGAFLTEGSEAAESSGPWQPQFVALPTNPPSGPSLFSLRDILQPESARDLQTIEVREGSIERPLLVATKQGGLLAWTLRPTTQPDDGYLVAQRFAYNGDRWKVGERIPLLARTPGQTLLAIAPLGNERYFIVWTEPDADALVMKAAIVAP
jgi:hypothetical protein